MNLQPKPLYDWLKMLSPTDPVLTANFTDVEFEKICMLLRKWDSDRLATKALAEMYSHPEKFFP